MNDNIDSRIKIKYNVKHKERGENMIKAIRLSEIGKIFANKKLKKVKKETKDNWIYDYEWGFAFKKEKYRQEFLDAIKRAEENIKEGRVYTEKEMDEYYRKKFGIDI